MPAAVAAKKREVKTRRLTNSQAAAARLVGLTAPCEIVARLPRTNTNYLVTLHGDEAGAPIIERYEARQKILDNGALALGVDMIAVSVRDLCIFGEVESAKIRAASVSGYSLTKARIVRGNASGRALYRMIDEDFDPATFRNAVEEDEAAIVRALGCGLENLCATITRLSASSVIITIPHLDFPDWVLNELRPIATYDEKTSGATFEPELASLHNLHEAFDHQNWAQEVWRRHEQENGYHMEKITSSEVSIYRNMTFAKSLDAGRKRLVKHKAAMLRKAAKATEKGGTSKR